MRVGLYARVSTGDRGQDPETQLLPLREWATREGHAAIAYVDTASAADLRNRTEWTRLLADCRAGRIQAIAVVRLDRAFRSSAALHTTLKEWELLGIDFVSLRESFDTATPVGRLMLGLVGALAEFERDLIADRVRDGMARAAAEGKHVGRPRIQLSDRRARAALTDARGDYVVAAEALGISESTLRRRIPVDRFQKGGRDPKANGLRVGG